MSAPPPSLSSFLVFALAPISILTRQNLSISPPHHTEFFDITPLCQKKNWHLKKLASPLPALLHPPPPAPHPRRGKHQCSLGSSENVCFDWRRLENIGALCSTLQIFTYQNNPLVLWVWQFQTKVLKLLQDGPHCRLQVVQGLLASLHGLLPAEAVVYFSSGTWTSAESTLG